MTISILLAQQIALLFLMIFMGFLIVKAHWESRAENA